MRALVATLLLLVGCNESLYAPVPEELPCGTAGARPCRFDCELDCAATTVEMATACMQSLQGTLDESRTRCDFVDGSRVTFAWSVPAAGTDLTARSWNLELQRPSSTCLQLTAEPLPWLAGTLRSATEVKVQDRTYRQELTMTAGDSGGPVAQHIAIDCPDGRHHEASGAGICQGCADGDCRNLPLLEVAGSWSGDSLDLELRAGEQVTPLLSCR